MPAAKSTLLIAKLLWFAPVMLLLLSLNQVKVARDLGHTLKSGEEAIATVVEYEKGERADITYDYVSLHIPLDNGEVIDREHLSLPHSLIHELEGVDAIPVLVLPGAAQEVVIASIGPTQQRIAAMNAAISFVGFLIFFAGVFWWNRDLKRRGDPSLQGQDAS